MTIKLDKVNKKILCELEHDARQPISKIAKTIGLSKEVVNYRIKKMLDTGVLGGFYTLLDIGKMGYMYSRLQFTYRSFTPAVQKKMIAFVKKFPQIGWIAITKGPWDIVFVMYNKTIDEINTCYLALLSEFGEYLNTKSVSIAHRIYHFKSNFLHDGTDTSSVVLHAPTDECVSIDDIDFKLLHELAQDARLSLTELSSHISSTVPLVRSRLKRLIDKGIILGFRPRINYKLLGYEHQKVFLHLTPDGCKNIRLLREFLSREKKVVFITEAIGSTELEFEVKLKGKNELYEFMIAFTTRFPEAIENYDTVLIYEEPFVNYFPFEK